MTAEEFLQSKDIWHHPYISDRENKKAYQVSEMLEEYASSQLEPLIRTDNSKVIASLGAEIAELRNSAIVAENLHGHKVNLIAKLHAEIERLNEELREISSSTRQTEATLRLQISQLESERDALKQQLESKT